MKLFEDLLYLVLAPVQLHLPMSQMRLVRPEKSSHFPKATEKQLG